MLAMYVGASAITTRQPAINSNHASVGQGNPEMSADIYSLTNKFALVTGAAKRIGASIAELLHANGANIAIHYRQSATDSAALCSKLNEIRPGSAQTFQADLSDTEESASLVSAVTAWSDCLDILVNNASSFYPTPLGSITEQHWLELIGSNLKGPLFLSQAAAPHIRKGRGVIINITDIHARRPLRDHTVYGSAKAGLCMLTQSLAKDLAPDVRVNAVAPGAIAWPKNGMSAQAKENIIRQIPLGRTGDPEDIANCVLFLTRDATYVSGQTIAIDGGRSVGW